MPPSWWRQHHGARPCPHQQQPARSSGQDGQHHSHCSTNRTAVQEDFRQGSRQCFGVVQYTTCVGVVTGKQTNRSRGGRIGPEAYAMRVRSMAAACTIHPAPCAMNKPSIRQATAARPGPTAHNTPSNITHPAIHPDSTHLQPDPSPSPRPPPPPPKLTVLLRCCLQSVCAAPPPPCPPRSP